MVQSVEHILATFDALSPADQNAVIKGIVARMKRRSLHSDSEGDWSDEDLAQAADKVFVMLDEEESRHGTSESW